jgi:Septum formation initiator.
MKKRTVRLRFKLLLLTVFLAYAVFMICSQQENIGGLLTEQETLSERYEQAQIELQRLKDQSAYMNTRDYIEDTARERLGYVYENEIILTPPDGDAN